MAVRRASEMLAGQPGDNVATQIETSYAGVFVEKDARMYQGGAIAYAVTGHSLGLAGLFHS
ncbi:MAG TPA: hypothetical protein VIS04_00625, partial [Woeseiaceae bacterium]